ncbi:MAG: type I DNA topoisomerase [Rikenellaceae bacterium]|nr:type I DNA topoisomerase [Rikenellaceae bacterium]
MHENLVIVESPAKAKTLEKFLGKEFTVKSSYGHIRDLAKKDLGIDIEHGFTPTYEVSPDKKKVVPELAKAAKSAKAVWLASDEDREGEAIAWHLTQVLGLPVETTRRIVFHEITKGAILDAVENPRTLDMNLVNAQQARRVLDRIVGFELSPLLWRKVKPSLSAGRVQSVTVRLVVEREREILDFTPTQYYRVSALFYNTADLKKILFRAELNKRFETHDQAQRFLESCSASTFTVESVEKKPGQRFPAPPFTTSTLQQEASRKLGMSVSQTMATAQRLYENGLITYMRTDSVNLSKQALAASKEEIVKLFGAPYSHTRNYKTGTKGAQEAHEAIRPSYFDRSTLEGGTPAERKLYELIWKRAVASQMAPAQIEKTIVKIDGSNLSEHFTATGEVVLFDGFLKLYTESHDDEPSGDEQALLPQMVPGDVVEYKNITATQSFTKAPPRYSEASLVRRLEELGIGRPSTYAPTISTVINRGYVIKQNRDGVKREYEVLKLEKGEVKSSKACETTGREKNRLSPTDIGMLVNDYLESQFANILDYNFTAKVEKEFDEIAEGSQSWTDMIGEFYNRFHPEVEAALENTDPQKINKVRVLGTDPATGGQVSARIGRYGPIVQIENEGEKPRYASLRKDQLIASITLQEALELFSLPRTLGELDGGEVVVSIGRFGPYVRYDGKFTSLEKSDDPYSITLERARELIEQKKQKEKDAKTPLVTFPEEPELLVLKGRYGPYISYKKKNYPIPRKQDPAALTLEEARGIIAKKDEKDSKK